MTPAQAQELISWIYKEKYILQGLENSTIAEVREQMRQGRIKPLTAQRLQDIYVKASGGGESQTKQYLGNKRSRRAT